MAFDYAKTKATADRLINKFGQPVTLTLTTGAGGYDDDGNPTTPTVTTVTGDGVKLNYNTQERLANTSYQGTGIETGDVKMLLGSASGAPVIGMTVPIDGETWRVMSSDPLIPGGTNVMYTVQLRK